MLMAYNTPMKLFKVNGCMLWVGSMHCHSMVGKACT